MAVIGNAPALGIITSANILDGSITAADLAPGAAVPSQTGNSGKYLTTDGTNSSWGALSVVKITSIDYAGDDLAADPAGGQTITVTGSGFVDTPTVYVNDTIAPSVSFVSSTEITFTTPAKTAGTYNLYVINTDGSTAIKVMGISYSGVPAWTTAAGSLGTLDVPMSFQLEATSNSTITYTLASGSSLPSGITLSSTGLIEGSVDTDQTFSFSVDATDEENQETPRSFSVTVSLGDEYFRYVTLLLSGDGTNAAQNNTFTDGSTNNFTITRNGNVTQGSFSPYGPNWANYFDGSSDYLTNSSNYLIANTTTTFTIEGWVYMTAAPTDDANDIPAMISVNCGGGNDATNYMGFGPISSRKLRMRWFDGASKYAEGSTTLALNTWYHVAVAVSSNTIKLFVNGFTETLTGTTTLTNRSANANGFALGQSYTYSNYTGYLSNVRVISGTALYSANFAPSTTPLTAVSGTVLLTCQSNRFFDASTNAYAVTPVGHVSVQRFSPFKSTSVYSAATYGGSAYLDGTTDSLVTPSTGQPTLTGDFTISYWVYPTVIGTTREHLGPYNGGTANAGNWLFEQLTSGQLVFYYNGLSLNIASSSYLQANAWTFVSAVRSGSTITLYFNGASQGTATYSSALGVSTKPIYIGDYFGGGYSMLGYLADIRLVSGSAITTVPTAPTTAVSGTQLLLSMTNAGVYDGAMMNDLETLGSAQISTSVKKYGTGSMSFNGTTDFLSMKGNPNFAFGTGDFTVEGWFYQTADNTYPSAFESGNHVNTTGIIFITRNTGSACIYSGGFYGSKATTLNTWNHIAWVRSSGVLTIYVNGIGSTPVAFTNNLTDTSTALIGGTYSISPGNTYIYSGYIDDFRITKGYARYTANFTPPTAALKGK